MASPQLSSDQQQNANAIIATAYSEGVGKHGAVLAIMAAMQESSLKNLSGGDRDSIGLFQQRPSMDWGTTSQIMDPVYATKSFLNGHGTNKGLKQIAGWQTMPEWQAIQAVQKSGYPQAYQKHLADATAIVDNYSGSTSPGTTTQSAGLFPTVDWGRVIYITLGVVLIILAIYRITGGLQNLESIAIKAALK